MREEVPDDCSILPGRRDGRLPFAQTRREYCPVRVVCSYGDSVAQTLGD